MKSRYLGTFAQYLLGHAFERYRRAALPEDEKPLVMPPPHERRIII